ncbi:AMP-binding protein [Lysinibacillus fusiformis]|uniref:AMP-binding protein n=1 Tax=Lysinibacillus fusiformis TaxID=28031 RepID=UPI001244BC8E|nr:AMP-binding protein [Lysinibacillus fusiformis]KAB0444152.1 acyl-CoA synthase [Lysinibacillus fusiformis]
MMFYVNDQFYTVEDIEKQFDIYERLPYLKECNNRRLAICTDDIFQYIALCLYIREKRGSVVPIHPATPKEGAIRIASTAGSHLLLFQSIDDFIELSNLSNNQEGVLVQMSSGTTGAPKCIERTWSSVDEEVESYVQTLPVDSLTNSIVACPVTHSYGFICGVLACIRRGAKPVIITNNNPKYMLKKLKEYPHHILYGAPALLYTLSRLLPSDQQFDRVMTSGTVMPHSWLTSLREKSNQVLQQYGCSESGCVAIHPNVEDPKEMGYPLPHVKVTAGDKQTPSEIIIETSTQTIYTKDLGYLENNILSFLARIDDTINVAGLNVYPQEVENVLMDEPRIVEAVVYKKQDHLSGERVCALYVSDVPIDHIELREWCRKFLAPHQIPVEFVFAHEIQKLPNGKISRKKLGGITI